MEDLARLHLDAALGLLVLLYIAFIKLSEMRSRKGTVVVKASVLKIFPHSRCTSFFVGYTWQGAREWRSIAEHPSSTLTRWVTLSMSAAIPTSLT